MTNNTKYMSAEQVEKKTGIISAYMLDEEWDSALQAINNAVTLCHENYIWDGYLYKLYFQKARVLSALGRYKESLSYIDKLLNNSEKHKISKSSIYFDRAFISEEAGDMNDAIKYYTRSAELNDKKLDTHYKMAVINNHLGRYSHAITSCDNALKRCPEKDKNYREHLLLQKATAQFKLGFNDLAIKCVQNIIISNPGIASAYYVKAMVYMNTEKYDCAEINISKAIELCPDNKYFNLKAGQLNLIKKIMMSLLPS